MSNDDDSRADNLRRDLVLFGAALIAFLSIFLWTERGEEEHERDVVLDAVETNCEANVAQTDEIHDIQVFTKTLGEFFIRLSKQPPEPGEDSASEQLQQQEFLKIFEPLVDNLDELPEASCDALREDIEQRLIEGN